MAYLDFFIKECEKDLISTRKLSENTLYLFHNLSTRDKSLCEPIIAYIRNYKRVIKTNTDDFVFLPNERILVCRLIPLYFALDTNSPAWSSYMLTEAIKSASTIFEINLSEIGAAFLEVFCRFSTPLNKSVYSFCIDFTREFTIYFRERRDEFGALDVWGSEYCQSLPSVAYLKYMLVPNNSCTPEFIFKTTITLIQSEFFNEFAEGIKYLLEDLKYKEKFQELLLNIELPNHSKNLISSTLEV